MRFFSGSRVALLALVALTAAGCHTPHSPQSNRAASVLIKDRSAEQINDATKLVFARHAYEPAHADADELVFQKPGTFMNALMHGDWYSGAVWERVKLYQRPLNPSETVLEGDFYMVQQPEDPFFQKEQKVNAHKSKLQKMLDEVAAGLGSGPPPKP